jgi:acyl-CoA thioester hydrolase
VESVNQFVAEVPLRVRYAETDAMGIVHHSSYIVYFEEARSAYARERGVPYSEFERTGHYLVVSEVNVRYLKPARYEQALVIRVWISEMKSRTMIFQYEVLDSDTQQRLATAVTKHVCVNRDGQIARIPAAWRDWSLLKDQ